MISFDPDGEITILFLQPSFGVLKVEIVLLPDAHVFHVSFAFTVDVRLGVASE